MKISLVIILILLLSACQTVATQQRPAEYYRSVTQASAQDPLFESDGVALNDANIERILQHQLSLPPRSRVAILRLSGRTNWRTYSNDFVQLTQAISENLVDQLRQSERVYDASFLPSLLVPKERTVAHLREAAARYQADLLLAYRSSCNSFDKYKLFNANEAKAYCSVELVLLDVRSGIVPFTAVSSNEFAAREVTDDTNFNETIRKAEHEAIAKSLKQGVMELTAFLDKLPKP